MFQLRTASWMVSPVTEMTCPELAPPVWPAPSPPVPPAPPAARLGLSVRTESRIWGRPLVVVRSIPMAELIVRVCISLLLQHPEVERSNMTSKMLSILRFNTIIWVSPTFPADDGG